MHRRSILLSAAAVLALRDGECDDCHFPRNPKTIERLVLLQTPAHAAAEIKRILHSVRSGEMPEDEDGHEKPCRRRSRPVCWPAPKPSMPC